MSNDIKMMVLGMKRALNAIDRAAGDIDFAEYTIKRAIAELEKSEDAEATA